MNTVLERDRSVVLHNISWNSYKTISDVLQDETPAHFTYDGESLEILVLSIKHERLKRVIANIFEQLAVGLQIDSMSGGSTTFRREDIRRGFEPDECYYVRNVAAIREKDDINLDVDPAPDLAIEVDISRSSLNRFAIFASVGIREVWRYDAEEFSIFILDEGEYRVSDVSSILPNVEKSRVSELIEVGKSATLKEFFLQIENYSKELKTTK